MSLEIVQREIIYRGRAFNLRRDQVRYPDGRLPWWDVIEHRDSVVIIPIDQQGKIWFIRQYRHPIEKEILELPAGVTEPGEAPHISAQREIQEEIGMRAGELTEIGRFYLAPGYSSEYMYVFLARDLNPSSLSKDEDELIVIQKIDIQQALTLAETGELDDAKSIAALFRARPLLCSYSHF